MCRTLVVIKPSRIKRIPVKQWCFLIGMLFLSLLMFFGAAAAFPHLTDASLHELSGPISNVTFTKGWGRHSPTIASFQVGGEPCRIALNDRDLSFLLRSKNVEDPTKTARVLATGRSEVAELEYDGALYHTLAQENAQRSGKRAVLFVFAALFLLLDLFLFAADLFGYSVIILRTRPKSMNKSIVIEK